MEDHQATAKPLRKKITLWLALVVCITSVAFMNEANAYTARVPNPNASNQPDDFPRRCALRACFESKTDVTLHT